MYMLLMTYTGPPKVNLKPQGAHPMLNRAYLKSERVPSKWAKNE